MKAVLLKKKYAEGQRDFGGADLRGAHLIGAYLRAANLSGANLRGANLIGASLSGANLSAANLSAAYLSEANLSEADLIGADLGGANLGGANLGGADLRGAYLSGAYLRGAHLRGANLRGAYLPSPTVVLLAHWGEVSRPLCRELMRYDAANHPRPSSFLLWSKGGRCPYNDVKIQRAASFNERADWYIPGEPKPALWLMRRVIREKCRDSDYHTKKDRERWS